MTTIKTFAFNPFQENTYVLYDETNSCVIIDPGMSSEAEQKGFTDFIESKKLEPVSMINTHCHIDHVLGCRFLKDCYNIPLYIHNSEYALLKTTEEYGAVFGLKADSPPEPDNFLSDNQVYTFGETELKMLHVPGHSPGSIAIYCEADNYVLTGDVLFQGSIGRTDLPGGDYDTIIHSIKSKLMILPSKVHVYPGHGNHTTIEIEKTSNPFLV